MEDKKKKAPPWYIFALQFKGKKENDAAFSKMMIPKWSLFGMNLGTISDIVDHQFFDLLGRKLIQAKSVNVRLIE